jgi:homoserine kinase
VKPADLRLTQRNVWSPPQVSRGARDGLPAPAVDAAECVACAAGAQGVAPSVGRRSLVSVHISVPASSANLGPGFDALGLALDLPFELCDAEPAGAAPDERRYRLAEPTDPAAVAHSAAGGTGPLWWRSGIPPGKGLGFSGAARVAGAMLGLAQQGVVDGVTSDRTFALASELEGHADNVGASLEGSLVVTAEGLRTRVEMPDGLHVVTWTPETETSTVAARSALPATVPLDHAVSNIGRAALLVAALAAGDLASASAAFADDLHEGVRLADDAVGRDVLATLRGGPAIGAWLSGSGPTVAALVDSGRADHVVGGLTAPGQLRVLEIDRRGAVLTDGS